MILTCPECATSYFVDDSRIAAAGRTVKCSNCGARWTARPEGSEPPDAAAEPAAAAPAAKPPPAQPASVDELMMEAPQPRAASEPAPFRRTDFGAAAWRRGGDGRGKVLVWAASAVAAVALISAVILFRAQVVQVLPFSQAAYAGLGMPVSSLAIEEIRADPAFQGGRPVLAVSGQIRNLRDAPAEAPPLRVSLLDRFGRPVAAKVAHPINAAVPAKAIRHFSIAIVDPPASARDLEVAFEAAPGASRGAVRASALAPATGPQPDEARPLPPGSPDALPAGPR
jgi:predicted Zn finger-like uncharacterized protein